MIKALFFDIDGTLVSFQTHKVPQSTISSLEKAKSLGVKIFISTGRHISTVDNLNEIRHLIDGFITTNGACCTIGDSEVRLAPIPEESVKVLFKYMNDTKTPCLIMGIKGIAAIRIDDEADYVLRDMLNLQYDEVGLPLDEVMSNHILQITPFVNDEQESALMSQIDGCTSARWFPAFTDITSSQADKASGLEAIARAENISIEETMAFGDGGNDVSILTRAGIGVAMGNAIDKVKSVANYVTTSVDDDGVENALRHFGVI